jgi:uncharacterized protein YciI
VALFAVIYRYRPDEEALDEHRPAHRAFLRSLYQAGKLVVSGPLGGDADPAALLIFDTATGDEVATLLDKDPFRDQGLIAEREIRPWTIATGSLR